MKNLGNHVILFTFDNEAKVDTIMANESWSFDKHLMVLQQYGKDSLLEELLSYSFLGTSTWHSITIYELNGGGRTL